MEWRNRTAFVSKNLHLTCHEPRGTIERLGRLNVSVLFDLTWLTANQFYTKIRYLCGQKNKLYNRLTPQTRQHVRNVKRVIFFPGPPKMATPRGQPKVAGAPRLPNWSEVARQ